MGVNHRGGVSSRLDVRSVTQWAGEDLASADSDNVVLKGGDMNVDTLWEEIREINGVLGGYNPEISVSELVELRNRRSLLFCLLLWDTLTPPRSKSANHDEDDGK